MNSKYYTRAGVVILSFVTPSQLSWRELDNSFLKLVSHFAVYVVYTLNKEKTGLLLAFYAAFESFRIQMTSKLVHFELHL